MENLVQDVRVALRAFRRSPGFPLTAVATLALGIGASTAIFTTLNAVLLKPLPYPSPRDLYSVRTAVTDGRVTTGLLSGGEISRLNGSKLSIERAAGFQKGDLTLIADDGTPSNVHAYAVTEGFFELFGLPMTAGGLKHDDFTPTPPPQPNAPPQPGPPPAVVISTRLWQQLYHGDPAIVGKPIHFAEFNSTISGVAPRDLDIPQGADVFLAQRLSPTDVNHGEDAFVRLRHGSTIEHAKSEMTTIMAGLATDFPNSDKNRLFVPRPLVDSIVGDLGPILIIVMSATGLLLLLACVNVANLLLSRGAARAREMAVRAALGAGMGRLVRQLLTESLILATAGTIVGLAIGALGLRALLALGAAKLPRLDIVSFDARVSIFSLAVLSVTAGIIGLAPVIRLMRSDMKTLMSDGSRSATAGRGTARWLMTMTAAEVALAIMLVAGAGWLVQGFANLRSTDAGFATEKRVLFDATFFGQRYPTADAQRQAQFDFVSVLRNVPGVTGAGLVSPYPLRGALEASLFARFHGQPFDAAKPASTHQRLASPGLFAAMGTPILKGRDFSTSDLPNTEPVAIVNHVFVARYLNGRDPIGAQFSAGYPAPDPTKELTIVGVVGDVRQKTLAEAAEPAFYTPMAQFPFPRATVVVSISQSDPSGVERSIRTEMRKLNPTMAIDFFFATDVVADTLRRQELGMTLMLVFGGIAVVLAAVGIYGVISYAGSLRREEMATRLALGATPASVFFLVLRQGITLACVGAAIGIGLTYLSGQLIASRVSAIPTSNPLILIVATLVIGSITLLATTIPASRAARLHPSRVLRSE